MGRKRFGRQAAARALGSLGLAAVVVATVPAAPARAADPQTITFANPGAQNFGTSPTLVATSDSTLPVTFSSSTTGVCTISAGGTLTFVSAGTCSIDADQPGDATFDPAPTVTQSFTVIAVVPGAPTIGTATAGDTTATVTFTPPASNGGAPITDYTVAASPADVAPTSCPGSPCLVTGLTNGQAYTFTVTATNNAGVGPPSTASNSVTPLASQTITFSNPGTQDFGTSPTLTATADSGLSPTFTSSTTGVCTITSLGALTFVSAGSCTINADQAGNGAYLAATTVTRTFAVAAVVPGAPTIGTATAGHQRATVAFTAPPSNGGALITLYTATSSPGGLTGTCASSPCTVAGLTNGVAYTFNVTATNSAGTGAASADSNSVMPAAPPCRGLTATVSGSGTITGTPGDDVIVGSIGPDTIDGLGGNDTICALGGDDTLLANTADGNDTVFLGPGDDIADTSSGTDLINGGAGADTVTAAGVDPVRLIGGAGIGTLTGG
ncbi:fibronectin type III domain-containing protein, partial [Nocardioides stalactiti]|uniref:fibronectin type III domain-containing protein n=1 Tax=Nocardioides stalactiti TaxID=2755356 RepID=UPI0016037B09